LAHSWSSKVVTTMLRNLKQSKIVLKGRHDTQNNNTRHNT
jgi:hypothetical protein